MLANVQLLCGTPHLVIKILGLRARLVGVVQVLRLSLVRRGWIFLVTLVRVNSLHQSLNVRILSMM